MKNDKYVVYIYNVCNVLMHEKNEALYIIVDTCLYRFVWKQSSCKCVSVAYGYPISAESC